MKNGNMKLVVTDNKAPSRLLEQHSAARLHLAKLIDHRLGIEDRLRALTEAANKLREAQDAEGNAAVALNALDAEEARAMSTWSQKPSGSMPVFDRTRREKLKAAVEDAAAQASAARKAAVENGGQQQRELMALKALEPHVALAIAEVISESVTPLLEDFEAANKKLSAKAARIQEAIATITDMGHAVGNPAAARPTFVVMERLFEKVRAVSGRPVPDSENHRAAWMAYAAKLRSDPIATLED
jgi:hypothetical protein